jgi:hypothetical protein
MSSPPKAASPNTEVLKILPASARLPRLIATVRERDTDEFTDTVNIVM